MSNPTPEMPRFDFSGCEIVDDAQLDQKMNEQNKGGKFFKPGLYDVEIAEVEYQGAAKSDPNWGNLAITYKQGEKEIRQFLLIPFREIQYGAKKTLFPFKQFQGFCKALGANVTRSNLEDTMKTHFARPEKLKGAHIKIKVGYRKGYIEYAGKGEDGTPRYQIHTQDGNVVCSDMTKQPILFADRPAAFNYATENGIAVDQFVNVLETQPSETGSGLKTSDASW